MGGRSDLWKQSGNKIGLQNPYESHDRRSLNSKLNFTGQTYDDDMLEFNSAYNMLSFSFGGSYKVA